MLSIGAKVKNFSLYDGYGRLHQLNDYLGRKVVIYFYPKDDTKACTEQACGFRDQYDTYQKQGIIVIGISKDTPKSHQKFIAKYDLPFILLSDESGKVLNDFGVWVEKSMYGRTYMGIQRSVFVLNEEGIITHVFEKASPKENASDILKALK
jgi:peroxiredoxin Q/BCP